MFSGIEERLVAESDREAMERNLKDLHRRLDEYEGELAAYCAAIEPPGALRTKVASPAASC